MLMFLVVAFRMMPKILLKCLKLGLLIFMQVCCLIIEVLLINFAINGEEKTGATTTFFINEKIDEGNILLQEELPISPDENAGSLHDRLMEMGAKLVVKTLDGLAENSITEQPQPQVAEPKNAFKIFKEDTRINWNQETKVHKFHQRNVAVSLCFYLKVGDEIKGLKIYAGNFEIYHHQNEAGT
jgi:methionyl-tRNA formyltransferase